MLDRLVITLLLLAGALCLATAASAQAQGAHRPPPGLSGADEYLETVPNAGGNSTVGNGGRPALVDPQVAAATKAALPASTIKALERRGPVGANAAALAGSNAPDASDTGSPSSRSSLRAPTPAPPAAAIGRVAAGSGNGMGLLFSLLILGGTLVAVGSTLWRRRGSTA